MKVNKKFSFYIIILIIFFAFTGSVNAESEVIEHEVNNLENKNALEKVSFSDDLNSFEFTSKKAESKIITNLKTFLAKVGANYPKSYQTTGLTVKNQENTTECWAFAFTSAIEAYNKVHNINNNIYSPRHVDYSCSKSFTENVSDNYFNREVSEYGNMLLASAYATSLKGPVLESDMPFKNNTSKISLNELNKLTKQQVTGIEYFDNVYKKYNSSGVAESYYDSACKQKMTNEALTSIRNKVKEQIQSNGGIVALIYSDSSSDILISDSSKKVNHAVLIVGWDDDYKASSWKNPGAYIALNSYGTQSFKNGYCYISYDDIFVESSLVGITGVKDNDSYEVYEYDELGAGGIVSYESFEPDIKFTQHEEISAVNIYNRDTSKKEILKEIGITNLSYERAEIYFTDNFRTSSNGNDLPYNFVKISKAEDEQKILDVGYHVFELNTPIELTKDKFAICVRFTQANENKVATVAVEEILTDENGKDSEWYRNITGKQGETYFIDSFNPNESNKFISSISIRFNKTKTVWRNASIKAFTTEISGTTPSPTPTPDYKLNINRYSMKDNIITRVSPQTDINVFRSNITVTEGDYSIVDKDGNTVTSGIIKTGYKLKIDKLTYPIAVIGDLSGDGKVSISDIAKMRMHLVSKKGCILTEEYYYAADTSGNNVVSIQDLMQIRNYIVGKLTFSG